LGSADQGDEGRYRTERIIPGELIHKHSLQNWGERVMTSTLPGIERSRWTGRGREGGEKRRGRRERRRRPGIQWSKASGKGETINGGAEKGDRHVVEKMKKGKANWEEGTGAGELRRSV